MKKTTEVRPVNNLERYFSAVSLLYTMFEKGIINESDFVKAEKRMARKYCIKKYSIFRQNDLINSRFRAIYNTTEN